MVIPRFVDAARAGRPVQVYGDGRQSRCFCHVADSVEAVIRLMRSSEAVGQVVNVGNDQSVQIRELAEQVIQATRSTSQVELVPYASIFGPGFEDMRHRKPSLKLLERLTGFRPRRRLDEILIDLAGLHSGGTAGDLIGANGSGVCHLGQITAAVNGTLFAGRMVCLETPATGDNDIDLYSATEATGVEDTAISALTATQLCNSGDLTNASVIALTAVPAANKYLYLVCQAGDASTDAYTAGILLIELWGKA
jgi:hypothetical protein